MFFLALAVASNYVGPLEIECGPLADLQNKEKDACKQHCTDDPECIGYSVGNDNNDCFLQKGNCSILKDTRTWNLVYYHKQNEDVGVCDQNYAFWLQPQFELCEFPNGMEAMCYPTAAASLLAYYKDEWGSEHELNYPLSYDEDCENEPYTKKYTDIDLWGDLVFKIKDECKTDYSKGTDIDDGTTGLQNFLGDKGIVSLIKPSSEDDSSFLEKHKDSLPFMLHIKPECAQSVEGLTYSSTASEQMLFTVLNKDNTEPVAGSSLGHTVVVWEQDSESTWLVASNLESERHFYKHRHCLGSVYKFGPNKCIEGITTISFGKEKEKSNTNTIVIASSGGVVFIVLTIALYSVFA